MGAIQELQTQVTSSPAAHISEYEYSETVLSLLANAPLRIQVTMYTRNPAARKNDRCSGTAHESLQNLQPSQHVTDNACQLRDATRVLLQSNTVHQLIARVASQSPNE